MTSMLNSVGVIGAGQMGRGIAQVAASCNKQVILFDIDLAGVDKAFDFIQANLLRGVEKGKWDENHVKKVLSHIVKAKSLNDLKDQDIIIEAATENKKIKFELFNNLDKMAKESAILASNTSSISITELGAQTNRPDRVVGMHFMNPVPVMKLVEGIRGLETSEDVFLKVEALAKEMGKTFVKANDFPGFIVNRILMPMINEAIFALYEGVGSVEDIDSAMVLGTNQPMGPLKLADFIGLDTCLAIMEVMYEGFGDPKFRPCPLLKQYVKAKRFGKKSGRGFYQYS